MPGLDELSAVRPCGGIVQRRPTPPSLVPPASASGGAGVRRACTSPSAKTSLRSCALTHARVDGKRTAAMKDQVRLDIPLLLPEIKDKADRCIGRLTIELQGRTGVQEAHVVASHDDTPAQQIGRAHV